MAITSADANVRHNFSRHCKHYHECREMMTTLGTPELVLVLIALGGMTAAATWGVIELKRPRR
jgi:hypothetical protein